MRLSSHHNPISFPQCLCFHPSNGMPGGETIPDPTRLMPEGPGCLRKALCFFLLHMNHRHFIPWPFTEAALRYLLCRVTACGSQGTQTWPRAFLVPCISTRMTFGYQVSRKAPAGWIQADKSHVPTHTGRVQPTVHQCWPPCLTLLHLYTKHG